jgi:hypothetical protein
MRLDKLNIPYYIKKIAEIMLRYDIRIDVK